MMSRAPNLKALEKIREVKDSYREVMDGTRQICIHFMVGNGTTPEIAPLLNFLHFKILVAYVVCLLALRLSMVRFSLL